MKKRIDDIHFYLPVIIPTFLIVALMFGIIPKSNVNANPISADTGWIELCTSNCGFESGNMSGWTEVGGNFDVRNNTDIHSGAYAIKGTETEQGAYFLREISIASYRTWIDSGVGTSTFGAWLDPGSSEYGRLDIKFLSPSKSDLGNSFSSGWVRTSGGYEYFGGSKIIPSGTEYIRLEIHAKRTETSETQIYTDMNVDDVTAKVRFTPPDTPTPTRTPTPTSTPTPNPGTLMRPMYLPLIVNDSPPIGTIHGQVVNAVNSQPISGATVCVLSINLCVLTDNQGNYTLAGVPLGPQSVRASAAGYITLTQSGIVRSAETATINFSLSPVMTQGEMRIVLTWGENPHDLDSHLWLPSTSPYHIWYPFKGSQTSFPFANLDLDDRYSYGPETVTIKQRYPGEYTYAVYLFDGSGSLATSGAKVQVYQSSELIAEYLVPTSGEGRWWSVFDFDGLSGAITIKNMIMLTCPGPYDCRGGNSISSEK